MCRSQLQYDPRLGFGRKDLAPLTFLEKSRPVWGPLILLSNWYWRLCPRVTDRGTKLSAFLQPVSRLRTSGAVPLRPLSPTRSTDTQYECDMCRSRMKQKAERCRCGCVKRRLARQSEQTELVGWLGGTLQTANTKERNRNVILFNLSQKVSTPRYCSVSFACYSISRLQ